MKGMGEWGTVEYGLHTCSYHTLDWSVEFRCQLFLWLKPAGLAEIETHLSLISCGQSGQDAS